MSDLQLQQPNKIPKFQEGDVVYLVSGGFPMAVVEHTTDGYKVCWMDAEGLIQQYSGIDEVLLTKKSPNWIVTPNITSEEGVDK